MTNGPSEEERKNKLKLEIYETIRDHIKHENTLINNRLTWIFTLQGFLFAGLSLLIKNGNSNSILINIFAALGVITNILGHVSVCAAQMAIEELDKRWKKNEKLLSEINFGGETMISLGMKGAGSDEVHFLGQIAPYCIPIWFGFAWGLILYLSCHGLLITPPKSYDYHVYLKLLN